MGHWLLKSEPSAYSWTDLTRDRRTAWTGVRNHQAANNLRAMRTGDRAYFYHSNEGLAIVGTVEIVREAYPDPDDKSGRFVAVDVAPVAVAKTPVTLAQIKAEPRLKSLALVRQGRLSVSPVSAAEWMLLCRMAGLKA
ncbi:MAG: EVE domain-containing protein [Alphaproteobacteria bacterium]|nr:EVE domain-containing protein [Alphaproteobacteria bacterium]